MLTEFSSECTTWKYEDGVRDYVQDFFLEWCQIDEFDLLCWFGGAVGFILFLVINASVDCCSLHCCVKNSLLKSRLV